MRDVAAPLTGSFAVPIHAAMAAQIACSRHDFNAHPGAYTPSAIPIGFGARRSDNAPTVHYADTGEIPHAVAPW